MTRSLIKDFKTCLSFDGADDYVDVGSTIDETLATAGLFTISGWINPSLPSTYVCIMAFGGGGVGKVSINITANGTLQGIMTDGSNSEANLIYTGEKLQVGNWYHVAWKYENNLATLYLDGVSVGTKAYTGITIANGLNRIGVRPTTNDDFKGRIDEVRVYNRALSDQEVLNLYFNIAIPSSGLVGEWLFNEGSGTTALDSSGNGNTGTISGATYSTNVPMVPRPLNINTKNSLYFDGSSYVTVPNKFADSLTGYTISYWVKASDFSKAQYHTYNGLRGGLYPRTYQNTNKTVQIQYRINGVTKAVVSSSSQVISSGTWNFVVATIDVTSGGKIYLNGNLAGVNTDTGTYIDSGTSGSPLIGGDNASNNFTGNMTNVRAWNRALTQDEITNLYLNKVVPEDGLTSEYLLDEGVGSTTADTSGSNNNGTITGALWSLDTPSRARLMNRDMKSSLSFAGAGYAQLPAIPTTTGLSITAWIKTQTPVPAAAMDILGRSAGSSDLFEITTSGELRYNLVTSGGTNNLLSAANVLPKNTWCHVAGTYDITTGVANLYLNGVIIATQTAGSGTMTNNASTWLLGALTTVTRNFTGNIVDVRMFDGALTAAQVLNIYQGNSDITTNPTLVAKYALDQGAGTPIDTSGKGYNATSISAATYVLDTPFYKRQAVNPNLVKNGDFEYVPPFTAVQNTGGTFIDGTAGGTTSEYTRRLFPWAIANAALAAGATVRYDPTVSHSGSTSLLLSSNDTTGTVVCIYGAISAASIAGSDFDNTIKVLPSTSYTLTAWVKTNNVPTNGVYIDIRQFTNAGTNLSTTSTSKLTGTNDWTQLSLTFTTGATASNATILLRNGVSGNVSSAWFDDIVLKPTTATTRLTA